jgi:putative addiction module killer protein
MARFRLTRFESLRDMQLQAAIDSRLARVRAGNLGDYKSIGNGVFELRIHVGSGVRVYFAMQGAQIVILLGGGDKRTQKRDIRHAQQLWKSYKSL